MDRGAWWATASKVAHSWTRLKQRAGERRAAAAVQKWLAAER